MTNEEVLRGNDRATNPGLFWLWILGTFFLVAGGVVAFVGPALIAVVLVLGTAVAWSAALAVMALLAARS